MQVTKPQVLMVQTAPTQMGPRAFLGVSLGLGFRLSDPRILCHEATVWAALGQIPQSAALVETASPKRHAEWLLVGHAVHGAVPRHKDTVVEWPCSVELNGVKKALQCRALVPGRGAIRAGDSAPPPVRVQVLLDPSNAWCGAEQENPLGQPAEAAALHLCTPRGAQPSPTAATAALDMRWSPRARFRPAMYGTLQEAANDGSHMGWPAHTDLRYFQQAPSDQWMQERQWPLGAAYTLQGMGADGGGYANALPALHPQVAWQALGGGSFQSVDLAQQTVWFLPDADMGVLWWHGQIGLDYPLDDRVAHLAAAVRGAGDAFGVDALAAVALRRADRKTHDVASESDQLLLPPSSAGWTWEQIESLEEHPNESPPRKSYAELCKRVQAREAMLQQVAAEQHKQQARTVPAPKHPPAVPVVLAAEPLVWQHQLAGMAERHLRNAQLVGQDLRHMQWSDWTLEGVTFKQCMLDHSRFDKGRWKGVRLEGCSLVGATLSHLQWMQGSLQSCNATQLVWDTVQMEELSLSACDLTESRMAHCQAKRLMLVDLYGAQGQIQDSRWENCSLQNCQLPQWQWQALQGKLLLVSGCQLQGLQVQRARLDSMSAIDSDLSASRWQACRLDMLVCNEKSQLSHSQFTDCQLARLCANGTEAAGLQALHCSLPELNAKRLQAPDSVWTACDLHNAQLSQANLHGAVFETCSLKEARLFGADLRDSRMRQCNLIGMQSAWAHTAPSTQWHSNLAAGHVDLPRRQA